MGFFDFLADAGSKVFGKDEAEPEVTYAISTHIQNSGVDITDMKIDSNFTTGLVILSGYVPNQEQKEKAVLTAGNVAGISRVQDNLILGAKPADVAAAEKAEAEAVKEDEPGEETWESKTYTVKSGDTLGKIAKEFYGNAMEYPKIFEANKPMLENPDKIYPGQVLRIPE